MNEKGAEVFHEHQGINQCIKCGNTLTGVVHHYYCNRCWARNQLDMICKHIDELFKRTRRKSYGLGVQ